MTADTESTTEPSWLGDYRRRGFVHMPAVLGPDEVQKLRTEADRVSGLPGVLDPDNLRTGVTAVEVRAAERTVDRIDPVVDLSPLMARFGGDPRIVEAVTAAIDAPVYLVKDKLILKPPGADGYGMHQDAAYYPVGVESAVRGVAAMITLDASDADNGALEIVPGVHELLSAPGEAADCDPDQLPEGEMVPMAPGDMLVFSLLAPHRSGPNRSSRPRRAIFYSFVPDDGTDQRTAFYDAQLKRLAAQLPPERRERAVFR